MKDKEERKKERKEGKITEYNHSEIKRKQTSENYFATLKEKQSYIYDI